MASVTLVVHYRVRQTLLTQMRVKGAALARGLAANAAEAMLTRDRLQLAELVDKTLAAETGIVAAALVDADGVVVAHSDFRLEGRQYREQLPQAVSVEPLAPGEILGYARQGDDCLDFSLPVRIEGKDQAVLGSAHVVYSLSPIKRVVYETLQSIFLIAAGGLIIGILFALAWVRQITRPVAKLAQAAGALGQGDLDVRVPLRRRDELGQLAVAFNAMAANLKQAQADLLEKERMQHEMEIAQRIQNALIPKRCPEIPGYSLSALYRGALEVSGDYYDFVPVDAKHWGIVVGDVSGKGVPAGLVMAQIRSTLRSLAPRALSPQAVLARVQAQMYPDMRDDMFVTASYVVLDPASGSAVLSRAGHLAAWVYRRAQRRFELALPNGIAIGISDPDTFSWVLKEETIHLRPGDFIFLYTDGVDEAYNRQQEFFGSERLLQTLLKSADLSAADILAGLDRALQDFMAGGSQTDDITMVLVKAEEKARAKG
ncbi:MAG: SpoIIE family protein phosphatase [candidate division FCPU426 bacterium]